MIFLFVICISFDSAEMRAENSRYLKGTEYFIHYYVVVIGTSVDAIQHDARGLTLFWQRGGFDPSGFGLL